ncbi:MAG: winged helix-turn-helix transcriptional regulator [Promethearchaeota archaeon]
MCNNENTHEERDTLDWHCLRHENIKDCIEECKVQSILNLFGKKFAMPIIRLLLINKKMRFNQILENIKGSPKTITSRLRDLEKAGLIRREVFNEIPIRVEYSLTKRGISLEDIFERFARWALNTNWEMPE